MCQLKYRRRDLSHRLENAEQFVAACRHEIETIDKNLAQMMPDETPRPDYTSEELAKLGGEKN